ncbi:MAG: hypothetical protein ACXWZF_04330 [Actinomycetota bacterium]
MSVALLALGSSSVIDPGNFDFTIVGNRALNVAMFVALFPLFGFMSVALAERFDRWLLHRPLVRLAPLTLVGKAVGCGLGVLGIGVLAVASGFPGSVTMVVVTVLGIVAAFARGGVALGTREVALVVLVIATAWRLVAFVQDVDAIVG